MDQRLRGKFDENTLMTRSGNPRWPDQALDYRAATWAHRGAKARRPRVNACRPRVLREIQATFSTKVLAAGGYALSHGSRFPLSLGGSRRKSMLATRWRSAKLLGSELAGRACGAPARRVCPCLGSRLSPVREWNRRATMGKDEWPRALFRSHATRRCRSRRLVLPTCQGGGRGFESRRPLQRIVG